VDIGLRYLIALCKEIDEPYEEYQKALYGIVGTETTSVQNEKTNGKYSKSNSQAQPLIPRKRFSLVNNEESENAINFEAGGSKNTEVNLRQENPDFNSRFFSMQEEAEDTENYDVTELLV